jgi:hypothetical protein
MAGDGDRRVARSGCDSVAREAGYDDVTVSPDLSGKDRVARTPAGGFLGEAGGELAEQ